MKRVRYLLGLCSPADREHIESEYFENEDAFREMLTAEDDLIDAYARGELAGEELRGFEKSFVSSLHGRDRVQFARAFAGIVSAHQPVKTRLPGSVGYTFHSPGLFRTATIAAVIVLVAMLAWLVNDRRRMTNELRELRSEFAELNKRTEALPGRRDIEGSRTALIPQQPPSLRGQPDKHRHRERGTTATQRAGELPDKNNRETIASSKPKRSEKVFITQDASMGNTLMINETPILPRKFEGLLSLQPAVTSKGFVSEGRADQANVAIDGIKVGSPISDFLTPWNISSSGETTIHISHSLGWIRFQIALEKAITREDCRVTIKTAAGRPVTSVDWSEPLVPNQTIIDTPYLSTSDLRSGNYVLLLMGKEPDGSFVKVAEYFFKVIKY